MARITFMRISLTSSTVGTRTAHEVHRDLAGLRGGQYLLYAGLSLQVFGGEPVLGRRERQERVHIRELRCGQRARVQGSRCDLRRRGRGTVRQRVSRPTGTSQRGRRYLSRGVAMLSVSTARKAVPGDPLTSQASSTVVSASIATTGESIRSVTVLLRVDGR